jgi:hypothetical protein
MDDDYDDYDDELDDELDDDENIFQIDPNLPELSAEDVERRRLTLPISLWPLAVEVPEFEGDIPSELQPLRTRAHGRWEEVESTSRSPLELGDVFETRVRDAEFSASRSLRYRVHGRTAGTRHDWLVVELLTSPRPAHAPKRALRVGFAEIEGERVLVAAIGDARWRLGVDEQKRYSAVPIRGATKRHERSREAITEALIDQHLLRDHPLPTRRSAVTRAAKKKSPRSTTRRTYRWTLSQCGGGPLSSGVIEATSSSRAIELVAREVFKDTHAGQPKKNSPTQWVWPHVGVIEVQEQ